MAYSKAPTQDTYSSERVPLYREINTRVNGIIARDEDYLNCYIDVVKQAKLNDKRKFITKRSGSVKDVVAPAAGAVRGSFYWKDTDTILYSIGNKLYSYNVVPNTTTTLSITLSTTTGEVGFTDFLKDDGTVLVVFSDGVTLGTINTSLTIATSSSPDLPNPHLPNPIFLDGYLFLVKADTADIYNSDLNDPLLYTAGNFLSAELEGDVIVKLAKLNNYIVAFGSKTIEYFWDAGNETASPLQRNDSVVKYVQYLGGGVTSQNTIFFVGSSIETGVSVYKLEDLKIVDVGTNVVSRYLTTRNISQLKGAIASTGGTTFYIIDVGIYTYALSLETQIWSRFAYKQLSNFPISFAINAKYNGNYRAYFFLDNGDLHRFDETGGQDDGVNFTMSFTTDPLDFGTVNRKTMSRLTIIADQPTAPSSAYVSWSNNDYLTFTTPVEVPLKVDAPRVHRLGSFRQRSFKITYTDQYPMRFQELEVNINKGSS